VNDGTERLMGEANKQHKTNEISPMTAGKATDQLIEQRSRCGGNCSVTFCTCESVQVMQQQLEMIIKHATIIPRTAQAKLLRNLT